MRSCHCVAMIRASVNIIDGNMDSADFFLFLEEEGKGGVS